MEGTPFRGRLPVEQQTPSAGPHTPQVDNVVPSKDQLRATPLNMFQESSPSTQQQQAASSRTDRSPWRTARVVTELPAIPTRPNQSYGTTGTVTLPKMNINETGFGRFGNSLQGLTNVSADAFKSRRSGRQQQQQPDSNHAVELQAMKKQFPRSPYSLPKPGLVEAPLDYSDQQDYRDQQREETGDPDMADAGSRKQISKSCPGWGGGRIKQVTQGVIRIRENGLGGARNAEGSPGYTEKRRRSESEGVKRPSRSTRTYDPSNWGHIRGFFCANWQLAAWNYLSPYLVPLIIVTGYLFIYFVFVPSWNYLNPIGRIKSIYRPIPVVPIYWPFRDESRLDIPWEDKSRGSMTTVDKPWPPTTPGVKAWPKKTAEDGTWSEKTAGDKARPEKTPGGETRPEKSSGPRDDSQTYNFLSLERRVTALEIGLERALEEKSQDLQKWDNNFRALYKSFETAKASTDQRLTEIEKLEIGRKLNRIGDKLEIAVKDIAELKQFRQATDAAFAQLYKKLPKKLPVRYDDKGKIQITPEFWQDLTRWLKEQRYSEVIGKGSEGGTETVIIEKPVKWEDFLARNGKLLDAHIGNLQDKWHQRALREQTLIPKEHHLELVKDLRDEYLKGVEEQFKEVHHELGAQLSRITNLRSMIESGEFGTGTGMGTGVGVGKAIGKFQADGLYSHHISKLADYASHAGGGFIDPERTSETYEKHPPNTFSNWAHWMLGTPGRIPKPGKAISSDARKPGNCWPFAGKTGNLGIILRDPVYVTGMTLEHIEWNRCFARDATPKSIIFWVRIMETEKYYKKAVLEASKALGEKPELVQATKNLKNMYDYVKVGKFEYEFTETSPPEQTFWIPMDMRTLNISSDKVLLHFYDNYGNPNYTCIYRVKVHGEPSRAVIPTLLSTGKKPNEKSPVTGKVPKDVVEGTWEGLSNYQEL
ncbi:UNC-like C-terminal-domain-containing protein [Terfezia claveryi]|nr:UNC-like C-terminal-domain-containing protein [Terfezia claveryi]